MSISSTGRRGRSTKGSGLEVRSTFGNYKLLIKLHTGHMADIFVAATEGIASVTKLVVLKILHAHLSEDAEFISEFLDEAQLSARLAHPHIVTTFEVGERLGRYYIAMEYLEGRPLRKFAQSASEAGATVSLETNIVMISDVLDALEYAHSLNDYDGKSLDIVHRDVVPRNVIITGTPGAEVKLIGFGVARARGRAAETRENVIKGTVHYMAPEQALGKVVDKRADLFSAGLLLWEAVTGERFWPVHVNDTEVLRQLIGGEFHRPLRPHCKEAPALLEAVCRQALSSDPRERFSDARAMKEALEACFDPSALAAARAKLPEIATAAYRGRQKVLRSTIRSAMVSGLPRDILEQASLAPPVMIAGMRGEISGVSGLGRGPSTMTGSLPSEALPMLGVANRTDGRIEVGPADLSGGNATGASNPSLMSPSVMSPSMVRRAVGRPPPPSKVRLVAGVLCIIALLLLIIDALSKQNAPAPPHTEPTSEPAAH